MKLVSKSFTTPKGCHVRWVELKPGREALVGYDCGNGGAGLDFDVPGGGRSNYPKTLVKKTSSVHVSGSHITGHGARVDFVLMPDSVTCRKTASETELKCTVYKSDGRVLSGASRKRRRR